MKTEILSFFLYPVFAPMVAGFLVSVGAMFSGVGVLLAVSFVRWRVGEEIKPGRRGRRH